VQIETAFAPLAKMQLREAPAGARYCSAKHRRPHRAVAPGEAGVPNATFPGKGAMGGLWWPQKWALPPGSFAVRERALQHGGAGCRFRAS
ncbi:MAG: hypothetical protein ACLP8B_26375, partial [Xanthobacteraceae bacterium]